MFPGCLATVFFMTRTSVLCASRAQIHDMGSNLVHFYDVKGQRSLQKQNEGGSVVSKKRPAETGRVSTGGGSRHCQDSVRGIWASGG